MVSNKVPIRLDKQAGEGYVATPVQPSKVDQPPKFLGVELKWIS
jgi:hypothetical protein